MSSNLQNSIWPNTDGNLGNIKVEIPDGVTTTWPTGDALVHNFVFNKGNLVGFVDTKALIANSSKSTIFPYDYVNISLPSIAEGEMTYNYDQCAYFILNGKVIKGDIPTDDDLVIITKKYLGCTTVDDVKAVDPDYLTNDIVDGVWKEGLGDLEQGGNGNYNGGMFYNCTNLTSFTSDLSSLTNGVYMFGLCKNLTSFSSDLPNLTDGSRMFSSCLNLSTFSSDLPSLTNGSGMFAYCNKLESFNLDLSSLTNGERMFISCDNLTSFSSDLSSLTNGNYMFNECNLTSFSSDLPSLTDGVTMFGGCDNLESFSSDLSNLTDGASMFGGCNNLTSFSSDLPNLTDGYSMFSGCDNLTSFTSDLSSLTNGVYMFENCDNLTSFSSDLSSLTIGYMMFGYCRNLTSFNGDLSSLTSGNYMFYDCKLVTASVQNIADTIKDVNGLENEGECSDVWKYIHIGIGNSEPNEQEIAAFNTMVSKGWTIYVNGSEYTPTSPAAITTLDENGEETVTPIPYWAKPVQTDEQHAQYTDSEGNFFIILGAQFIYGDDLSTYGMFTCEEDASAQMGLTKIEK